MPNVVLPRLLTLMGSSAAPLILYWYRPVISAKRVGEHTGEFE